MRRLSPWGIPKQLPLWSDYRFCSAISSGSTRCSVLSILRLYGFHNFRSSRRLNVCTRLSCLTLMNTSHVGHSSGFLSSAVSPSLNCLCNVTYPKTILRITPSCQRVFMLFYDIVCPLISMYTNVQRINRNIVHLLPCYIPNNIILTGRDERTLQHA